MSRATAVLFVVLAALASVSAQPLQSAGELAEFCRSSDTALQAFCVGRIEGYRSVVDELPVLIPDATARIHIEPTATNGELERVFVKYVADHPETEHKGAFLVFSFALRSTGLMTETKR
jgi:hypothetical protein